MWLMLHLQLARLSLWHDQSDHAYQHLTAALQHHPNDARWQDLALMYYFYASLFHIKTQEIQIISGESLDEDTHILRKSYLKLGLLYLDTGEKKAADEVFQFLAENTHYPIHRASILAIRGAIAAEGQGFVAASKLFTDALQCLNSLDEPRLKVSIQTTLLRTNDALAS